VRDEYQMFVGDVEQLMDIAEEALEHSEDDYEFTDAINTQCSKDEKLHLVTLLWRVILADKIVDQREEALVEEIAAKLNLSHAEVRTAARDAAR
jgi:uncharacterized tellurite resistance protein B-like protein